MNREEQEAYDRALSKIQTCRGRITYKTKLDLGDLKLKEVPPELALAEHLTVLDLRGNRLTAFPKELLALTSLRALILDDNQIAALTPEIGQMRALESLSLDNNRVSEIPPTLGKLRNLREFSIKRNALTTLPATLGSLANLTSLRLANNQLTALPAELGELINLTILDLANNRLIALPGDLGRLANLTSLDLADNQLSAVPPELGQLTNLTDLFLDNNQLTMIPAELGQLIRLKVLFLDENQLTELPMELGGLGNLTRLAVNNNQLAVFPEGVGQMTSLERLNLENNKLREIPISLQDSRKLQELTLHGNVALKLPPELLGPSSSRSGLRNSPANPETILDYYFTRLAEGDEAMREVRLLLVGRGRVGKTSLLKVLCGEEPDKQERETPGITVTPLKLECPLGKATAHAWDFGGQEFLHGTHQIFLSERCVYLLVLEGRESNWEIETDYWMRFIQSFGGDSPVIAALNKYDSHKFSVDRFRLQERCPQIVGFVESDALTGLGIVELRALLERTVSEMPDVWLGVPKSWHRVKESLARMPENFLDYQEYQGLCVRQQVIGEQQQASLAETLHRLGIALNFRDHNRLKETSVLKPQWVTEGIYGVLRFAQAKDCQGVLERAWLAEALPAGQYPPEKHPFVMELMEKFEVAFALEEKEAAKQTERWLIPELLPENQPEAFPEFRAAGVKRLRFTYPEALPPGLLPRFIVRTHEMSTGQARWRSGVVLVWGGAKALVRLDRTQRRATVEVLGETPAEVQELFEIIRAHLAVLHGKVRAVEELEIVGHPDSWVSMEKLRLLEHKGRSETDEETKERALVTVQVSPTLDTAESPEARTAEGPAAPQRMRLFVSYASADNRKLKGLSPHLTILGMRGYIQTWDDKQLVPGEEWDERILKELTEADLVLLIYSIGSRASAYVQEKEIPAALARHTAGDCTLLVVPLDGAEWDESYELERELGKLTAVTPKRKPVQSYSPPAKGWQVVEQAIKKAVEDRRKLGR